MRWADRGWGGASELTTSNREAEGRRFEHQAGRDEPAGMRRIYRTARWHASGALIYIYIYIYIGQASLAVVGARVGRSA
jgi:hypothetical protein